MAVRLYADPYRCAIYEEAPGGGDPMDPASLRNRPVLDPYGWLPNVRFHSDMAYLGIAARDMNRVISHAAVGSLSRQPTRAVTVLGRQVTADHLLVTHNLGYIPRFFCIYEGRLIPHGTTIQTLGASSPSRFVTAFATTTEIRLFEIGYSSNISLAAVNRTYQVIVFRNQSEQQTNVMLDLQPGIADFGRGKFQAGQPHLRADGLGDVQWPIATSRTAAIRNGALRVYQPNGGYIDEGNFNGSLPAPSFLMTSAGV